MSEPIQPATTTEASPSPVMGREEAASAYLEGAIERSGVDIPAEPIVAGEGVQTPQTATPSPAPSSTVTPAAPEPPRTPRETWQEREARRIARAREEARDGLMQEILRELDSLKPPAAAAEAEGDAFTEPEPDRNTQWDEHLRWSMRKMLHEHAAQQKKLLQPVLEVHQRFSETAQQRAEREQQEQRRLAHQQRRREQAEEHFRWYAQQPGSEGFLPLVFWYGGHPGDPAAGIAPIAGIEERAMIEAGVAPERAARAARAIVSELGDFFAAEGLNAAQATHAYLNSKLALIGQLLYQPASGGNGQSAAAPAPKPPAAREVAALRESAAAARGVTGAPSGGGDASDPGDVEALVRAGKATPAALRALAAKRGIPVEQVAAAARRAGMKARAGA